METAKPEFDQNALVGHIDTQVAFQRRWRRRTMCCYVVTIFVTVSCSTAATIISALHSDILASVLAGAATVLISLDRSLMFREKWKLHVLILAHLEALKIALETGQVDLKAAVADLRDIMQRYAADLPFPCRD
jgi:hypothetical protein